MLNAFKLKDHNSFGYLYHQGVIKRAVAKVKYGTVDEDVSDGQSSVAAGTYSVVKKVLNVVLGCVL